LANERTLLAWIRTSLAMVGLGAALARIDEVTGGVGAVVFIAAGLFCLVLGTQRYSLACWLTPRYPYVSPTHI